MLDRVLARFVAALALAGLLAAFPLAAEAAPLGGGGPAVAADGGAFLAAVDLLLERIRQWLQPGGFGTQVAGKEGPAADPHGETGSGPTGPEPAAGGLATKAGPAADPYGEAGTGSGSDPASGG